MIVTIKGMVVTNKLDESKRDKPVRLIQVMQNVNEEAELIKIKDADLSNDTVGNEFNATCDLNVWTMNNRSGVTIKVIEHIKEKSVLKPVGETGQKKAAG